MAQTVSAALARKLSAGQDDLGDKPRSVLRALRLAFARAAGERLQLPLSVIGAKQANRQQDDLVEALESGWLLLRFADGDGMSAAACLDPNCVSAIVQTQTIGEVTADSPAARAFTDTDAAMVAPLVEEALNRAASLVEASSDQACLSGYEFVSRLTELRSLSLAMVEDTYRVFDLTVELAGGLRQGQISVLLPERPVAPDARDEAQADDGPSLEQASGVVRAELNAVICRMTLPLAALSDLEVGDVLPLTGSRLDRTGILTIDRIRAAVGRLGQCGGMRAVRLNEHGPLPALAEPGGHEFLESKTGLARQDQSEGSLPIAEQPNMAPDITGAPSEVLDPLEDDLTFATSEQMVAEISQLAGLTGAEDGPDRIG